jgi:hypothetical protein
MADAPISGLPAAATLDGTELIPVTQAGTTVKTTVADVTDYTIVEPTTNYQVLPKDDAVNCDGTFNVTFESIATAKKAFTVSSTNGLISLLADATIQGAATVSTGTSVELYPARGQWWRK